MAPTRRFIKVVSFTILALVALMVIVASAGGVLAPWSRTGSRRFSRARTPVPRFGRSWPKLGGPPPTQVQSVKRTGVTVHRFDVLPMLGVRGGFTGRTPPASPLSASPPAG